MGSVFSELRTTVNTKLKTLNISVMDKKELQKRAFAFIADSDEYAEIIPDGSIDKAAELMADFVYKLWECGMEYKPDASENTLPIDSVVGQSEQLKCEHDWKTVLGKDYQECKKCGEGHAF